MHVNAVKIYGIVNLHAKFPANTVSSTAILLNRQPIDYIQCLLMVHTVAAAFYLHLSVCGDVNVMVIQFSNSLA